MPAMSRKRKRRLTRNPDGTFKVWSGGYTKNQLSKKVNNYQGIATHIGKQFKKQNGRTAKVGDIHRTKNLDGSYNKQAEYYIKTKNGWRKSPTRTKKPSKSIIRKVDENSRRGR